MYIGVNGNHLKTRLDQLKDALIYNFTIDRLDLPFNELYGIPKNISNANSSVMIETLRVEIAQFIADRTFFEGVSLDSVDFNGDNITVVVSIGNENISIPLN